MTRYIRPMIVTSTADKPSSIQGVHNAMLKPMPDVCVWPRCEDKSWADLDLPLCPRHAARTQIKVTEQIPKKPQRAKATAAHFSKRKGTIYYASAEGLIKIGFSTDAGARMTTLKSQSGGTAHVLLASRPGTVQDEKSMHAQFGEYWVHGEYFEAGPRLMEHIDQVSGTG